MRRSDVITMLFLLSGFIPAAASAQQTMPDQNQATQVRPERMQQQSDQAQTQNMPVQPERTQPQSSQAETQNTPVQPPRTPQQADQARERERRSAEDTRLNRDWTARQQSEDQMDMDRMRQRHMGRMMDQDRMGRMMDQDEDHRTIGRNWRLQDDTDRSARYGWADRSESHYYRPRSRVKTCVEYENGDEFCRYRD
jgi:hypothetical protein